MWQLQAIDAEKNKGHGIKGSGTATMQIEYLISKEIAKHDDPGEQEDGKQVRSFNADRSGVQTLQIIEYKLNVKYHKSSTRFFHMLPRHGATRRATPGTPGSPCLKKVTSAALVSLSSTRLAEKFCLLAI